MFTRNEHTIDRAVRVFGGLALFSVFFTVDGPWHWAGLLGLVFVATGLAGFCPIYSVIGVSTCKLDTTSQG